MKTITSIGMLLVFQVAFSQNYAVSDIPENLKKNANAIIRDRSEIYIMKSVNSMTVQEKHAITIMDKAGDEFATVYIPYDPTTKVSSIKVNLYDETGKLSKSYSKKDFADYTNNPSSALYVDDRVLVLRPGSSKYPFTVETIYETNTSNTIYLNSFTPYNSFNVAVQKANLKIVNNSGIKIRNKTKDNEFGKVVKKEEGSITEYTYENLPAIKEQVLSPSLMYLTPKVEFSPETFTLQNNTGDLTTWDNFGKWYYSKLIQPVSIITPEISKEVAALDLSGSTSDKVKTLYQYMQNKTRYVLISMGIGGWQPMPASEVSKKGFGDCKALTNYMRTLLAAAGIDSYFAIIYDNRTEIKYDKDFPKLSGNHAILMVPTESGTIWLENTSQTRAFNHLSFTSHNRNVLAVKETGIEIVDTPVYKPEESKEILKAQIKLNTDAGISANANFSYSGGQYDSFLPFANMRTDDAKEALKRGYSSLKISDLTIGKVNNNRDIAEITYTLDLKANDYSKKLGADLFFPVLPFSKSQMLSENEDRLLPFETPFPYQDDYYIEYEAPLGYKFTDIPNSVSFNSEFGSYQLKFEKKDDNKLLVHRIVTMNKGLYPKEKFKDYAAFKKKTAYNDNTKIVLTK